MHLKQPDHKVFYGWWLVLGAAIGWALNSAVYLYGFGTFFDSLIKEFKSSRAALSGVYAFSRLETGILGPVGGFIVDRFGPRKVMLASITLMASGFMLLSQVSSLTQFYLVFVLMIALGAGLGFSTSLFTAVGNWFSRRLSIAFGLAQSGIGVGGLLVPVLSWLIAEYGWRAGAQTAGITLMAIGIPVALIMRHKPEQYGYTVDGGAPAKAAFKVEEQGDFTAREALRTPTFWLLAIVFAIRLMVTAAVVVHFMPFLLDIGFPREMAATALGLIAVLSVPGRLGFGWLGDRFSKRYMGAGFFILLAGSLFFLGYVENTWQLFLFLAMYAPAYGALATLMPSIRGEYFGRKAFGTIMGYMAVIIMMGTVAGPLFAGYVWDITGNYRLAFTVFAIASLVAFGMVLLAKRPSKRASLAPNPDNRPITG